MTRLNVLCIDDKEGILRFLRVRLTLEGYNVLIAASGKEGVALFNDEVDLVILDIQMSDMDGFQVLLQIRAISEVPVIILTVKDEDVYQIKSFELGADDYVTKPFNPDILALRMKVLLRRTSKKRKAEEKMDPYHVGNLVVDFSLRKVLLAGKQIRLSYTEWKLLVEFARHVGRVLTYEQILTRVWGPEYLEDKEYLRVWIIRLRHKFNDDSKDPKIILAIPRVGYSLAPNEHKEKQ